MTIPAISEKLIYITSTYLSKRIESAITELQNRLLYASQKET